MSPDWWRQIGRLDIELGERGYEIGRCSSDSVENEAQHTRVVPDQREQNVLGADSF